MALSSLESEKQTKERIALASNGTLCETGLERRFNVYGFAPTTILRQIHIPDAGINVYLLTHR